MLPQNRCSPQKGEVSEAGVTTPSWLTQSTKSQNENIEDESNLQYRKTKRRFLDEESRRKTVARTTSTVVRDRNRRDQYCKLRKANSFEKNKMALRVQYAAFIMYMQTFNKLKNTD